MMGTMSDQKVIELEQGWTVIQKGITKLKNVLEGVTEAQFNTDDCINLYTCPPSFAYGSDRLPVTIYNMCTQISPLDYSQQLYDRYREAFKDYIQSMVLPALRERHDESMLRELVRRWGNHKIMVRWLSLSFNYLEHYFIARRPLPTLREVGLLCFRELVYEELNAKVKDAVIALIDREREGERIDRALLKNVLGIFVEMGMGSMYAYEVDFEAFMLQATADYYKRKASSWIQEDSCPDFMPKAEECLKREKESG
eukprot:SM000083S22769  [mRNA]  locus=s83:517137:518922:+ [translate_table: standard]